MKPSKPRKSLQLALRADACDALSLLRALFELAEADVRPTPDLLERLLGYSPADVVAYIAHLRRTRLLQPQSLCLTLTGLALATTLPEFELTSGGAPRVTSNAA